ncbi:AraC family transcriptional regulator [Dyadobacter sp. CY261]|uniref:helix-turn-helix domain-containing protein n=1 Tax=Dyadobacter sp. CY261 TaxID=2907203 RepID=UPI001F2E2F1E|nr:AraC family transcriptional regulator [Dyadobacter sp. CY261]MCF0073018.1 AraC family transcriptional regulator [Dyadobacter sp. CY261]
MDAIIDTLYRSALVTIHDFRCQCGHCKVSATEYQREFSIAYVRTGNFVFKSFRNDLDSHHGHFLISKAGFEYKVGHVHALPDQCTIFSVSPANLDQLLALNTGFASFVQNPDRHSMLARATPETEYLHHCIFNALNAKHFDKLRIEQLTVSLMEQVITGTSKQTAPKALSDKHKRGYLPMIEKVKKLINDNICEDISLADLADAANISPFHFSRLFKQITAFTPYGYLLRSRLQNAHLQIAHTNLPVTTIAFESGFNSLEHFSAAYKTFFGKSPSAGR